MAFFVLPSGSLVRALPLRLSRTTTDCSWSAGPWTRHWALSPTRKRVLADSRPLGLVLRGPRPDALGPENKSRGTAKERTLVPPKGGSTLSAFGSETLTRVRAWALVTLGLCALGIGVCWGPRRISAQQQDQSLSLSVLNRETPEDAQTASSGSSSVSRPAGQRRVAAVSVPVQSPSSEINLGDLGYSVSDFIDKKKLFSPELAERTETQLELEEIEDEEVQKARGVTVRRFVQTVGTLVAAYLVYVGSRRWEEWMHEEERLATEQEISLTGTYIDPAVPREDLEKKRGGDSATTSSPRSSDDEPGQGPGPDAAAGGSKRPGAGPTPSAPGTDPGGSGGQHSAPRDRSRGPNEGLDLLDDLLD